MTSKKTHVARGSGARMADLNGCPEEEIRRMGRWNNTTMNGAYLTGLPRELMRKAAGFFNGQGTYDVARANYIPPESLQQKVFPDVSVRLNQLRDGTARQTVCAEGFFGSNGSAQNQFFARFRLDAEISFGPPNL